VQDSVETCRVFTAAADCLTISSHGRDRARRVTVHLCAARWMLEENVARHPSRWRRSGAVSSFAVHPPCCTSADSAREPAAILVSSEDAQCV
jgi:hypothetical protein